MKLRYRGVQYQREISSLKTPPSPELPPLIVPESSWFATTDLQTLQLYKTLIVVMIALIAGLASLVI